MKFEVISKQTGTYYKNLILKKFRENGDYISLWEVKNVLCNDSTDEDKLVGWWLNNFDKKIRVRETKKGWFLYLPETNSSFTWNEEKMNINPETYEKPVIGDITVLETDALEQLIKELEGIKVVLAGNAGYVHRPCTVKAKKSGLKEERQDRQAWFHRWADLTTGVQQVVAIVEFDDGHVEQVRPDRIVFMKANEEEE